jgi:hypothetical protein
VFRLATCVFQNMMYHFWEWSQNSGGFIWTEGIKRNQKTQVPQTVSNICRKNVQPYQTFCDWEREAIRKVIFIPCDRCISYREAFGNFKSMSAFTLLIEIYLPCKFQNFLMSRCPETLQMGGIPLKIVNLFLSRRCNEKMTYLSFINYLS